MKKRCLNCGASFDSDNENQVYCCRKCGIEYRKTGKRAVYKVRTFICRKCGKTVKTKGGKDKRVHFCCKECEKNFWKHPELAKKKLKKI